MGFLAWHYGEGLKFYVSRYIAAIRVVIHYFSLPLLIPTLFAPWKRLIVVSKKRGFDFIEYFQTLSFNIVSRFMGAFVRILLLITGTVLLVFVMIAGFLGVFAWILLPFLSIPVYLKLRADPKIIIPKLVEQMRSSGERRIQVLIKSAPGKYFVDHIGITAEELITNASDSVVQYSSKITSFEGLIRLLLKSELWSNEFLRKYELIDEDLISTAKRWDKLQSDYAAVVDSSEIGSAGIGLELLWGYTPTLDQYGTDLSVDYDFANHLIGREEEVSRMERALTGDNGVILVGPPGVGKKTVVLEFAHKAMTGVLGDSLSYKRLVELDYNFVFSESVDLDQKKIKLAKILAESESAGNIILVIRDVHRFTNMDFDGVDFTDVFEQYLEKRKLKIIAISTDADYERYLAGNGRLRKYFETVKVSEPSMEQAMQILVEAANTWEKKQQFIITAQAIRKILNGSNEYITETPFPEKALELLDAVVMYHNQNTKSGSVTAEMVGQVLSEKTGISFAKLGKSDIAKLTNLEEIIHQRLVNQETAVELISKILRSKTVGVVKTGRPIGSFLFLGPTGVGKTETAKVLAKVYFGAESEIIRFDMAEFTGREDLERLIGSVDKNQPGLMTTAIKNKPAALLLLDEIEKAPPEVYNLFLSMIDEGVITDAFGKKINCGHLFIVATSNAGAEYIRQLVSSGSQNELQSQVVDYIMKQNIFSPEFVNRFDGVVVYEPLSEENLVKIARILLEELAQELKQKNVFMTISNEAAEKLAHDGYEPEFGARPMRRIIDLSIGDTIGKAILEGNIKGGDRVTLYPGSGKNEFIWQKTEPTSPSEENKT